MTKKPKKTQPRHSRAKNHKSGNPEKKSPSAQKGQGKNGSRPSAFAKATARQESGMTSGGRASKGERIAKRIAAAGLCSRRDAERWIEEGRVQVNGETLKTPACVVTASDTIVVDGKPLPKKDAPQIWLYHKPPGLVCSDNDEKGRKTIFDDFPRGTPRLLSVGRLDMNSEGLLLLTNDGAVKRYLELPKNALQRTYRVRVFGELPIERLESLKKGITVDGIRYGSIDVTIERDNESGRNHWLIVTLTEGKNREVRKVMEAMGLQVNKLIRTQYGAFKLGNLERGRLVIAPEAKVRQVISKI